MRLLNKGGLFFVLILLPSLVWGQYYPSRNYSTNDGLPNNAVRSLFLDSKKNLWIGTENGVARLVNGTFLNLDEADGLCHNSCWDINQDLQGNMWFCSYGGGVTKYDGEKFTVFTTKNGLLADKTRKVFPFKDKMYVGTEQGISIIDINTNAVVTPKVPMHKEDFICISFFEYKGVVYFATIFDGLFKIDQSGSFPKIIPVLRNKNTYGLALYGSTLYSYNKGFIDKFNINDLLIGKSSATHFGKSIVWQMAKDKRMTTYAAAWGIYAPDGGLYKIEADTMVPVSNYFGIDSKVVLNVVYDDSKDILYVGSNDKGIYEVRLDKIIDYQLFDRSSIVDFENFGKQKLILHGKGLTILDAANEITKTIAPADFKKFEEDFLKKGKNSVNRQRVPAGDFELNFSIPASGIEFYEMVRHRNSFWVGSNIGIFEIDSSWNIVTYLPKHSLKIGFTYDGKFIETVTYAGIRLYDDVHSGSSTPYSKLAVHTPQYIVKIQSNGDKTYLLSVFNGLFVYKKDRFHSYLAEGIWKEKKFKHITVNSKKQLILAAEFGTVFVVDDSKAFKIVKTISKNEITGNTILFLEAYKDFILIGTEKGMNIYKDGMVRLIDKEQGLKDATVTTSEIFGDELWLGTKSGFYTIDLKRLTAPQRTVSQMTIAAIAINNRPVSASNYKWFQYDSKKLLCTYKDNSFSIDFIPSGHAFPDKLKFRYRLKSTNRWSPYSEKTNLFLPYLPHGSYTVEVEVFDSNAGKATLFKLLQLNIEPPFWMTWWFFALVFVVVFNVLVYFIFKSKRKSREKAVIQKRIAETKLEALLSQMNPHFMFNAMNAIQDYIISNDIDNSLKYIGEFAKLIRKTLENSSKQTIAVEEEIEYLKAYMVIENLRFDNRIETEFHIGSDVDVYHSKIPTMLLQPFVENVFVHAFTASDPSPKLTVSFVMLSETVLECKIIDNGMSLHAAKKTKMHHSKGIQLTKERLSLLQNTNVNPIDVALTENCGTIVTIRLTV